ncbi:MAG: hypothetical protein AB1410_09710 [Acidobacteriota bacterium]
MIIRKFKFISFIQIVCVFLSFVIIIYCSKEKTKYVLNEKPIWENKVDVIIHKILTIGTDDFGNPEYLFGFISDIAIDKENNVFILDHVNFKVSKYNSNGVFIKNYGYGKGQGPGEFGSPANLCVDNRGNVYVSDSSYRRISIFDPMNIFIKSFRTEKNTIPLNDIAVFKNSILFVGISQLNFWNKELDGIFQMYSLPEGNYVGSMGRSDWLKKNWRILTGADTICINKKNDGIVISHASPYEIEVFSKDSRLLRRFGRKTEFFHKVLSDPNNKKSPLSLSEGGSLCMTCLPDGKIVNVIRHTYPSLDIERFFDIFDMHGNYLITIPEKKFGVQGKYNLKIESDSKGYIWLNFVEPYPHIAKFKIEFREKKS